MTNFTNVEREKLEAELLRDGFEKVGDTTYRKGSQWVEWVDDRICASVHEQLVKTRRPAKSDNEVIVNCVLGFGPLCIAMLLAFFGFIDRAQFFLFVQVCLWASIDFKGEKTADRRTAGAAGNTRAWRAVRDGVVAGFAVFGFLALAFCIYVRVMRGI